MAQVNFTGGKIHYAGPLTIHRGRRVTQISSGYAACCSGPRAVAIRNEERNTFDPKKVTCKVCRKLMESAGPEQ